MSAPALHTAALLALPETTPATLYGLHELLASVGTVWSGLTGEPESTTGRLRPLIVSADGASFMGPTGLPVHVEGDFSALPRPDLILVTDLAMDLTADWRGRWPRECEWVREHFSRGALVCSVCTGAVFLAEAGLLAQQPATTHWAAVPLFRDHYPLVRLHPERILCPAGEGQRVITSGGGASWTDLALYLVARFAGEEEARRIARVFLLGDRSEGQLPFASSIAVRARARQHEDAAVAAAQVWIASHYAVDSPVTAMAQRAGLTERTFARRFRRATGYSPAEYVQTLRIEEARQMLETTAEPTDAVALAVGYQDPAHFRRIFRRHVGTSPGRYRQRYATLPGPGRATRVPTHGSPKSASAG